MQVIQCTDGEIASEETFSPNILYELGEKHLSALAGNRVTLDMDGPLNYDDNARTAVDALTGDEGVDQYGRVAALNIAAHPDVPFCWYAPNIFLGTLLKNIHADANRIVGKHLRLTPGAEAFVNGLGEKGYDIQTVTAGIQESAEAVAERLGIERVTGTLFDTDPNYTGMLRRFIGGTHKREVVEDKLREGDTFQGVHVGDSYSDVETLGAVPSVCFNPGCYEAAANSELIVVSHTIASLLPFFGVPYNGPLPQLVVSREKGTALTEDLLTGIIQRSHVMRKTFLPRYLTGTYEGVVETIRAEIGTTLPLQELDEGWFDMHAKNTYATFKKHGQVHL